jgi:hypothetical protein
MYTFTGVGTGNTFSFTGSPPLEYDAGVTNISLPLYGNPGALAIEGEVFNFGSTTITSLDLNYSIDNGSTITQSISGISIAPYTSYSFIHPVTWNPTMNGSYLIEAWVSNINDNADMNTVNDLSSFTIVIGDPIPNVIDNYLLSVPNLTTIATSEEDIDLPRDLDFAPILSDYELWVINKKTENTGGETVTIYDAGQSGQSSVWEKDGNAWHFMSLPTGIAFSENGNFATSPGVQDANHGSAHYTGPTLWAPYIYAEPTDGNGSHIDMVHQSPYSMGIAADHDNAFWVYNGWENTLDYYDFQMPHQPGGEDHADAIVRRYEDISFDRIDDNIVNHLVLDKPSGWLYMVDNGNQRILRMDVNSGSITGSFAPYGESLEESSIVTGVIYSVYIDSGLSQPAGIDIIGDRLIVSDYSNGDIIIYDNSGSEGVELGRIHTGSAGIQGIKIGPDGKIWYVNQLENKVYRIEYSETTALVEVNDDHYLGLYPNPSNTGTVTMAFSGNLSSEHLTITVHDALGRLLMSTTSLGSQYHTLDLSNESGGVYLISILGRETNIVKSLIIQK